MEVELEFKSTSEMMAAIQNAVIEDENANPYNSQLKVTFQGSAYARVDTWTPFGPVRIHLKIGE